MTFIGFDRRDMFFRDGFRRRLLGIEIERRRRRF